MPALAPFAVSESNSEGRRFAEPPPQGRGAFQRDRDRIIHCTAFRRLEYKTQVFINHEGDLFRTRLTHSLEVAQLSRSMARALGLNEDLVEAVALAHDLGHTPFGHAGQDALNACMKDYGGFEHNLQSLRIVDQLEERYASFDGLNLMFETREGILKHCSLTDAARLGDVGQRFLNNTQPSIEAQLVNVADEIAYNNHDVDDGLRADLITLEALDDVAIFARCRREAQKNWPDLAGRRLVHETVRRMINVMVCDLVRQTGENIAAANLKSLPDVRQAPTLVVYSASMDAERRELKRFLYDKLYRHDAVMCSIDRVRPVVPTLFAAYMSKPELLPSAHQARAAQDKARAIADYIAGMTDRYAITAYEGLGTRAVAAH